MSEKEFKCPDDGKLTRTGGMRWDQRPSEGRQVLQYEYRHEVTGQVVWIDAGILWVD